MATPTTADSRPDASGEDPHPPSPGTQTAMVRRWAALVGSSPRFRMPLVGLLALLVLGVKDPVAAVVAVLYAFLPFHFLSGEGHFFLSVYFVAPLVTVLALRLMRDGHLFVLPPGTPLLRRLVNGPNVRVALILVI